MTAISEYICPEHRVQLYCKKNPPSLYGSCGCSYPVINRIPRFVSSDNYAISFGLQWNKYRQTQLDSNNGTQISEKRLNRLFGDSLNQINGKLILEAGCGAGRFTEILLKYGAEVLAVDLSSAVEANYLNLHEKQHYKVCQADILHLPVKENFFDIVICIGVIQHTPDSKETIQRLTDCLKPGGTLIIDHYTFGYHLPLLSRVLRYGMIRVPSPISMKMSDYLVNCIWPIHEYLWINKNKKIIRFIRTHWIKGSPVIDYHEAYPELSEKNLKEWALLDTHDTLTDQYKHLLSKEEIEKILKECGFSEIVTQYAGNGVEARAKK